MRPKHFAAQESHLGAYVHHLLQAHQDPELTLALSIAQQHGTPPLQVSAIDGRHLEVLSRALSPLRILEIGTLCGYSAVCLSRGLRPGGMLYTCERSAHHAKVAQEVFQRLNCQEKIHLVFGEARDTLPSLVPQGPFDLIFIDADKENYPYYLDWSLDHLRSGGLLAADNVFGFGFVGQEKVDPSDNLKRMIVALEAFNQKCVQDHRLVSTFLPTGEGLMLAVRR